ncbi:small GTP-binding domain protein (macronuclear) [Tetrahymena thermophila SB210]|uniref:Small GTP-binding domain protein n=1 Tax=Tetrahymena thermophila (strain SB210) TaxID=312017 RepID=I7MAJ2_TETTS|nr:small GTP-binding domain protein [Tetrahymena thermophila SB210]EAS04699.2 small GTP-binding domain protein [Tetrahymena thermophila SB210]|eukprot:XP_001024944.2 small GTP-binding domain protein [Tetrahymena thermophila SB210]
MRKAFSKINQLDLFGSQIHLKFQGDSSYKTKFGSILSLIIIGIILFRLVIIVIGVSMRNNPSIIFNERQVDNPELFEATSTTFPLAFAMEDPITRNYYIDESIYTVHAQLQQKYIIYNSTTQENTVVWNITSIPVQRCSLENFNNAENVAYYKSLNYTNMYCFSPDSILPIQGDFSSPIFSQIQFQVKQCQTNCKSSDLIQYYLLKSGFGMQLSDAYVDPKVKEFPFKIYSRDMYWPTSLLMPQDVIVYIRNNYVYSDFGWVTSDIQTQKFPSYSYYESFMYPPSFQDYFLSMTFKFEKQKESEYQRNYQNIFDISSQIGGFSQTLLAIGFLLCRKLSQVQFDQQIINSVFNYYDSKEEVCEKEVQFQQSNLPKQVSQNLNNIGKPQAAINLDKSPSTYQSLREKQKSKNLFLKKEDQNQKQFLFHDKSPTEEGIITSSPQSIFSQKSDIYQDRKQVFNSNIIQKTQENNGNKTQFQNNFKEPDKESLEKQQAIFENKFNEQFKIHTKSMKLSIWDQIKAIFFPFGKSKKKKQIIQYSTEKLYYHLDIINILKKLIEVEKLKRLLLDQDQLRLFEYLPKPKIHFDLVAQVKKDLNDQKNQEINLLYQDNRAEFQKVKDAYQAYKVILSKQNYSDVDQKIVEMLDPNLIKFFEEEKMQDQIQMSSQGNLKLDYQSMLNKDTLKFPQKTINTVSSQNIYQSLQSRRQKMLANSRKQHLEVDEVNESSNQKIEQNSSQNSQRSQKTNKQTNKMLQKIDLFGSQIYLRFNGAPTYQSKVGSIFTLVIVGFILFRLIQIIISASQRSNPSVIFTERQVNDPALFQATSQSFPMAFAMEDLATKNYYIDESVYTVKAQLQQKFTTFNSSSQKNQTTWKYTDIPLQRCTSQNFQNPKNLQYFTAVNYTNMYCLPPDAVLPIQGDFPSPTFSQIQFIFQQCQTNCKSQEEINHYLLKSGMALYMSDAYVDPTQFQDPFQIYARNMFWPASLQMPQDIIVYIRNNYVYSDSGWIISDQDTKKFPSFSFYENFIYPPNFQQYFLTLTFKFEKQKENSYSRKYQDISSIISEIGGFSQSLLAIGFLICTKISQLQLNQQLVNSVFNYDESDSVNNKNNQSKQNVEEIEKVINQVCNNNKIKEFNSTKEKKLSQVDYKKRSSTINNRNYSKSNSSKDNSSVENIKLSQLAALIKEDKIQLSPNCQGQNLMINSMLKENFDKNDSNAIEIDQKKDKIHNKLKKLKEQSQKLKENHFNKLLEKQTKSMKLSIWEYVKSIFYPFGYLKKKKEVIEYSINKLYYNLDILQILKRLIEVEKLKRLLLDKDQIKLFDYLPKPTIYSVLVSDNQQTQDDSKRNEIDLLYQDNRSPLQKAKEAYEAYRNIKKKEKNSQLDEKIIEMLDPNLLSIFELQNFNSGQSQSLKESMRLTEANSQQEKVQRKRNFLDRHQNEQITGQKNTLSPRQIHSSIQEYQNTIEPSISQNIISPYEQKDEIKEVYTFKQLEQIPSNSSRQYKIYNYTLNDNMQTEIPSEEKIELMFYNRNLKKENQLSKL